MPNYFSLLGVPFGSGATATPAAPPGPSGPYFIDGYFDAIRLAGYMDI